MRMLKGRRVLLAQRSFQRQTQNTNTLIFNEVTYPFWPLRARIPVNKPVSSSTMPGGELRPLTSSAPGPMLRALPLPCALSVAAMRVSAAFCASRSHS